MIQTTEFWAAIILMGLTLLGILFIVVRHLRRLRALDVTESSAPGSALDMSPAMPDQGSSRPNYLPKVIPSKLHHPIQRQWVESSNVTSAGYDPETRILQIGFGISQPDERIYEYYDISASLFHDFLAAPSKGRFVYHQLTGDTSIKYQLIFPLR